MASPVGSARAPSRPEELLARARERGLALRRRRRALTTALTATAAAVVAAAVYLVVPGPAGQRLRTIVPAHPGGATSTLSGPTTTGANPAAGTTAAGGSGPAPPYSTATTSAMFSPLACQSSQLSLSVGPPSGAAGGTYYELSLTNHAGGACTLTGYPGVSFLDGSGHQIGQPAQRMGNETIDTVRVGPGASGYVTIRVTDPGVWPCPPAQSTSIQVYPPGQTVALTAPLSTAVCSTGHPAGEVAPVSATSPAS